MGRAIFIGGLRLWESFQYAHLTPTASPGSMTGLGRKRPFPVERSPNTVHDVEVDTFVNPVTAIDDLSRDQTLQITMLKMAEALSALDVAGSLNDLACVEDDARVEDVVGGPYGPGATIAVNHTSSSAWTPAPGRYALFRKPSSGEGFVANILGVGAGAITVDLPVAVDSTWKILDSQWHLTQCVFRAMSPGTYDFESGDVYRRSVKYNFISFGSPKYASDYNPPMDDA